MMQAVPSFLKLFFGIIFIMLQTVTASAQTSDQPSKIYNAQSINLANGMQVVVVENNRTPAVTHMVWYKIGGGDEDVGASGLAHYLEHLMFKGSELVPAGSFSKKVKSWGGNDNAFTSWDYTAYYQTVPKDRLEAVMWMEADRMRNLDFDDAEALTERDVVIQERKQRTDSNPSAQLSEAMRAALFVNHPYGRPIIGWDHELKQLNPKSAREFYKKYYAPKNAVLVISGDVKAKDVFEKANIIYGKISNDGSVMRPSWPEIPHIYGMSGVIHKHNSVRQPVWRKLFAIQDAGYEDFLALTVAEDIIGSNTGRLYQSLVVDGKIASAGNFHYGGINVSAGTVSVGVTPLEGVAFETVENAVNDVLKKIAHNGVSADEIGKSVEKIQDESVYERDSLTGPAMMIGYQLASGMTLNQIETWTSDLGSVSPDDVKRVVADYLIPRGKYYRAVTGQLLPVSDDE